MALTFTRLRDAWVSSDRKKTVTRVAFDDSYPTGGETVNPSDLGLSYVEYAKATITAAATTEVNSANVHYDAATRKLKVFNETPAEVADEADLEGLVCMVEAVGW